VIFIASGFIMIFAIGNYIFRGEGDTKTPMKFMIAATLVNIILDPIFIFVLDMGVKGAAVATLIANIVGCAAVIWGFSAGKSSVKIRLKSFKFDFSIIKNIFKIGIPSSLSQISMSISLFILMRIVSVFGPYAIAAYGIGFRLDSIAILPALGLMVAVIPIVGQNVGAGKFDRAEKTAYRAAMLTIGFTGIVALMFMFFPAFFVSLFNKQPEVIKFGTLYLRIVSLSYIFAGIGISINGGFLGAGDAVPALIMTLLRVIFLAIPLALILAFVLGWGLVGVWWAISLSAVVASITSLLWFRTGRWKKKYKTVV
jgi:putative MATE family efflux protein